MCAPRRPTPTITTMIMITNTNTAPAAVTTTTMATATIEAATRELPLYLWLSPAFPVGAFAYSHGLEAAAEAGDIHDLASLVAWLEDLADFGAPNMDAALFAAAFRAAAEEDWARLEAVNGLAVALANSRERRLETTQQGAAFVAAARAAWDCEPLVRLADEESVANPVAVASAAAGHGIRLESALPAYALSVIANLVSAAVRLSVIGQTDGQRALGRLLPRLAAMAHAKIASDETALGGSAFRSDLAALRHETQYSRLFRS